MKRYKLFRKVNGRVRYYTLVFQKTLFGEFELTRIYGSLGKKPTGMKREFFSSLDEAQAKLSQLLKRKRAKGYKDSY